MENKNDNWFAESLLKFFNSRKWFWIKICLDILSVIILAGIFWYLYNYIDILLTNPCELCEDMGMTCLRLWG